MKLTQEQIEAVNRGNVLRVQVPGVKGDVVLLRAAKYEILQEFEQDVRLQEAWLDATQQAISDLVSGENDE